VAVAGLGTIAQTIHLPLLERLSDRFELTALAEVSPALLHRVGERYGVAAGRRFPDVEALLAHGGFDALLLLTSGSHVPAAAVALRRGHAVLAEKPLGYAHKELAELTGLGGGGPDAGRLMVGYMKQYDPAAQRLAGLLEQAGGAAAVHAVDITVLHPSAGAQLDFARLPPPAGDIPAATLAALRAAAAEPLRAALGERPDPAVATLYSITMNSICHELSLIRLFAGAPATVDHAALWPALGAGDGDPPSVELSGTLPAGGRYGIRWLYQPDYPAYRETVAVHHATGSAELVFPSPYQLNAPTLLAETGGRNENWQRTEYRSPTGGFENELVAFHQLVTRGAPPLSGVREAAADITFAQQAVRCLAARQGLELDGEAAHA
jgi:predicted dehydrogenase